jgi:membrane protein implicated in regulation of membrane protease activity
MDDIRSVIQRAARRLFVIDLLGTIVFSAFMVLTALVLLRIAQKLFPTFELDWTLAALIGVGATMAIALIASLVRRPDENQVARTIDERAGLRESISTALCVDHNKDNWSKAIVTDASDRARRVIIKDTLPIETPKRSHLPVIAGVALLAVWWIPGTDIMGLLEKKEQQQANQAQIDEVKTEVNNTEDLIKKIQAQTGVEMESFGEETAPELTPEETEFVDPQEIARSAIKELTALNDKLEEQRNNEEGATFDAIKDMTRKLNAPKDGPMTEMARAMARGDFGEAQKQLEEMAEAVQNGDMSEEEKQQASEQLEAMKQQLEQMAENRQSLEEQLKAAGLSEEQAKQLATDPEALQKALEEAGASEEQAQQLAQAAQAQQRASDAASSMAQAMGQMASGMQQSNPDQMSQGLDSMSGQLSNMEMMQQEMNSLEQAMGECQGQLAKLGECSGNGGGQGQGFGEDAKWGGTGQYSQGNSQGFGKGSGGPGRGMGAGPDAQATDYMLKKERAEVNTTDEGPVIASTMVQGSQIKGESKATFSNTVSSATTQAAEAIETKRVPRKHENAVQHYFGKLDQKAKEASGEAEPAPQGSDAKSDG